MTVSERLPHAPLVRSLVFPSLLNMSIENLLDWSNHITMRGMKRIPFEYREFYDSPRMITFEFGGAWYVLDSPFDEDKGDYPDTYDVYKSKSEFKSHPSNWKELDRAEFLGKLPIADIGLDETRRKSIDAPAFLTWLNQHQ